MEKISASASYVDLWMEDFINDDLVTSSWYLASLSEEIVKDVAVVGAYAGGEFMLVQ